MILASADSIGTSGWEIEERSWVRNTSGLRGLTNEGYGCFTVGERDIDECTQVVE